MLNAYLKYLVDNEGSDLHLKADSLPIIRRNGDLEYVENSEMVESYDMEAMVNELLDSEDLEKFSESYSFDLSYNIEDLARFRLNISKDRDTYMLVARRVPIEIPTLDDLKLPDVIKEVTKLQDGIVLVTGATGSGKSTTVASIINHINSRRRKRIITLEDPIEFRFSDLKSIVTQKEIGRDIKDFSSALKYILRQDPDIIFVGEMRDLETVEAALRAAETGHLVLATIHTRDSAQTIDRIVDIFPATQQSQIKVQLANTIQMIVSQRLLPTKDRNGRVLAYEIMTSTPAVSNLIREGKTHQLYTTIETGEQYGMVSLERCLENLVSKGYITEMEKLKHLRGKNIHKFK